MKKLFTILMAILMSFTCLSMAACSDDQKTLQVYTNAGFAPYEYVNEAGEVVGVDIDVMQEIGEILGYKVVINDIEFDQILTEVSKSELAIGAAGMTKKASRDEVALASIPYAKSVQYVIAPKGTFDNDLVEGKLSISKLANLTNKAIGVQEGTTGDFMISDAISGTTGDNDEHITGDLEGKGNTTMKYTNAILASADIGLTVGAVVIDKLPAESIAKANSDKLQAYELDAEPEEYVLYCNKNATALVEQINKVLTAMIDGGVIDFYTQKHSGAII